MVPVTSATISARSPGPSRTLVTLRGLSSRPESVAITWNSRPSSNPRLWKRMLEPLSRRNLARGLVAVNSGLVMPFTWGTDPWRPRLGSKVSSSWPSSVKLASMMTMGMSSTP